MKIRCEKESLLRGLQGVYRAVSTKNTIFALSGILLIAEEGVLTFKATDMEIAIEYREHNITIEEEGSIIVPARYILEIAKKLPSEEVTLFTEGYTVYIRYSGSEITINGLDQEEFPAFPQVNGDVAGRFDLEVFQKDIKEVSIASALDESRPAFTGVLFEIEGKNLRMVATDTHRLALKNTFWEPTGEKDTASVLIPAKILREISKLAAEDDETVEVVIGNHQVSFSVGNILFISRLIDGKFPNYHSVIPEESRFVASVEIDVRHFLATLDRASIMVKDQLRDRAGKARLILENETLAVHTQNVEVGKIHESIPVFQEGQDIEVVVNSRYMLDVLNVLEEETMVMKFTGPSTPMVMEGKDRKDYLYLTLPLKS